MADSNQLFPFHASESPRSGLNGLRVPYIVQYLISQPGANTPGGAIRLRLTRILNRLSSKRLRRHLYWTRGLLMVLLSLLLASCIYRDLEHWPDSIPQQQLFIDAYYADLDNQRLQSEQEYLAWILSFYQGNLVYQTGWSDIESAVLMTASPSQRAMLGSELNRLGTAMGAEWAKHNAVRHIDSRLLALWGSVLQLASSLEQQLRSIQVISDDVNGLLAGELTMSDIQAPRYEAMLHIDLFDDF